MKLQELQGSLTCVIGAGRSGLGAVALLTYYGANVVLSDSKQIAAAPILHKQGKITLLPFALPEEAVPAETRLVVTSPGVPRDAKPLLRAQRLGIPVWSEIELAFRAAEAPIAAITGTNGKTTTTLLLAAMLQQAGKHAPACGNVSADEVRLTLSEAALMSRQNKLDALVAEVSSFQLEWVRRFAPEAAILTNITPDHMNRYRTFEDYASTKARLFAAQKADQWALFCYDDPAARSLGKNGCTARQLWYSAENIPPASGPAAWVEQGKLAVRLEGESPLPLLPVAQLSSSLLGRHSIQNSLAAASAALIMGVDSAAITEVLTGFAGVAHRMERVCDVAGRSFYNNSMCTNPAAAASSLQGMQLPAIVILGGAEKGLDFSPLVPALLHSAPAAVLLGQAAPALQAALLAGGYEAVHQVETLEEAVRLAFSLSLPGQAVLLCPACASFDMFADFEERGREFRRIARQLEREQA